MRVSNYFVNSFYSVQNERFGLVFAKTGSIISGTVNKESMGGGGGGSKFLHSKGN